MILRKSFDTLPQRIFYNYLLCLSPFNPVESNEADQGSQERMHALCGDILRSLYDDPTPMGIRVEPDDCFQLYVCNNRKPGLSKSFRRSGELMGNLYRFLCSAALNGRMDGDTLTVDLDKKQLKASTEALAFLPHMGFKVERDGSTVTLTSLGYPNVFPAMRLLAKANAPNGEVTGRTLFAFAMGMFDGNTDYLVSVFEREMGLEPGFFAPYFQRMLEMGYKPNREYGWCAEGPTFSIRHENGVSGVNLWYTMPKIHQLHFSLGSQIGVKAVLEDFENQPPHIQDYLANRLTDCTDCMGCTKGGRNAKFGVAVVHNGKARVICPSSIWIGFQVEYMNHDMMRALIDFSSLQAKYGVNWRKARK